MTTSLNTRPIGYDVTDGFAFTGMCVYARHMQTAQTMPVWAGEFHGIAGEGKVSEFVRGMSGSMGQWLPAYVYLSDHRTGEVRMVTVGDAHYRTV